METVTQQVPDALGAPTDNNDIRVALGSISYGQKLILEQLAALTESTENAAVCNADAVGKLAEKVDDIGASVLRLANLAALLEELESVITRELPEALEKLAQDPMLGMFVGPYVEIIKGALAGGLTRARTERQSPPPIEG